MRALQTIVGRCSKLYFVYGWERCEVSRKQVVDIILRSVDYRDDPEYVDDRIGLGMLLEEC